MKWKNVREFQTWSLSMKLATVFSVLISVVIVAVGFGSYLSYKGSIENEIEKFVPQTLVQANLHLETYINQLISISQEILKSPYYESFQQFEDKWRKDGSQPSIESSLQLNKSIQFISRGYDNHLLGIVYYTNNGYAYIRGKHGGGNWVSEDYKKLDWYGSLARNNFSLIIPGTRKERLFSPDYTIEKAPDAFTIIQPLPNQLQNGINGVLQISGELDAVGGILREVDFGAGSDLYVIDRNGSIVFTQNQILLGTKWNAKYGLDVDKNREDTGSRIVRMQNRPFLISFSRSSQSGWTIVSSIPQSNLTQEVRSIGIWTVGLILAAVLVSAVLARLIAYVITNPIRYLCRQLNRLEDNNFQVERKFIRFSEMSQLWNAYENMVSRIRFLIEEVFKSRLLKQEAEIKALRSQINPHFINNALENIRMTFVRGKHMHVEQALISLGSIMRYQALQLPEMVEARQEIDMVQHVLTIQKLRFGEQLQVDYDIDPQVYDCQIPSFLIQPLVENAVKYGSSPDDGCIWICIRIKVEDGFILGRVVDEGRGLTSEELEDVIQLMTGDKRERQIGLSNLYQRISLIYDGKGEILIDSTAGAGTSVTFRLPIVRPEKGAGRLS